MRILTDQFKTFYLDNYGECFGNAMQSEDARQWIEQKVDEGEDIYFVVGYHTVTDARITAQVGRQLAAGGELVIPVSTTLAAAGIVIPMGNLADPGLASSGGNMEDQQRQFVAQGEQIIAVQYCKISFRWFSSKTAKKAMLGKKTQWHRYDQSRTVHGEEKDIVEVDLEDDLTLEEDREKYTTTLGEILFSALELQ